MTREKNQKMLSAFFCASLFLWLGLAISPLFHIISSAMAANYARIIEILLHIVSIFIAYRLYPLFSQNEKKYFFLSLIHI
jgi:hypothetical protein